MHFHGRLTSRLGAVAGIVICIYLLAIGTTWLGVTHRTTAYLSLIVFSLMVSGWLLRRKSAPWHRTDFDEVLPLAAIALLISTVANVEVWQQIGGGLWFVASYLVVWYLLQDALANSLLRPEAMVDMLLLAGTVVIIPALIEGILNLSAVPPSEPIRIGGILGNPNNLGAFTLLIIPLLIGRQSRTKRIGRFLIAVYLLIAIAVLFMSDSRGAEFGLITAFLFVVLKRSQMPVVRVLLLTTWIALGVFLLILRGDSGRAGIYYSAALEFLQHPLTGTGLFTFRVQSSLYNGSWWDISLRP